MNLPTFYILGVARGGTSSLYMYLKQHPQIFFPSFKEPSFFSQYGPEEYKDLSQYKSLYKKSGKEKQLGDASPYYLMDYKIAPKKISKYTPDAKFIVILRDPVDVVESLYRHNRLQGWEDLSLNKALKSEQKRKEKGSRPGFYYTEYGNYYSQLSEYFRFFSRESFFIMKFNDFVENTDKKVKDIFKFLCLQEEISVSTSKKYNKGTKVKLPFLKQLIRNDFVIKSIAKNIFPKSLLHAIKQYIEWLNRTDEKQFEMDSQTEINLGEHYALEIKKLQNLLSDFDFNEWLPQ